MNLIRLFEIGALALALAATAAHARDDDDNDADANTMDRGACTSTAKLLFQACGSAASDDQLVAKAKCINIADARERKQCLSDARQARTDAATLCREQQDGRRAACAKLGEARYDPPLGADRFDSDVRQLSNPNPYFPLGIGHRWEYSGGAERSVIEVTSETKLIEGVNCVVVRDLVSEHGRLIEATDDWFASARDGNTWYFGEEVKNYDSFAGDLPRRAELLSNTGSFKHGREGDKAGIIMPAQPHVGQFYLEEFALGNAEDTAEVVSVNYAFGANPSLDRYGPRDLALRLCNRDCLVTKNTSLLEPSIFALKYYARGIGLFLEIKPQNASTLQLVACNFDPRCVALPTP